VDNKPVSDFKKPKPNSEKISPRKGVFLLGRIEAEVHFGIKHKNYWLKRNYVRA
jgi:hypothetical protein